MDILGNPAEEALIRAFWSAKENDVIENLPVP
jgi:hypothetical protein